MSEPVWVDLASERVGGKALIASDDFFAPKENLLKPSAAVFEVGRYTDRGKWMDGWESRRKREPGYDWCIVRLGIPGMIHSVTVDTSHFTGNYPESCSLDACELEEEPPPDELPRLGDVWQEIVPQTPLVGDSLNTFPVEDGRRYTHVRLNIYPDGGVARLRVHGEARPDWGGILRDGEVVDLVSVLHGGTVVDCSDRFFSDPSNLLIPGRSAVMSDGWETKRRRGPGHDWVVLALGHRGVISEVELDTNHFKGNFPDSFQLEGCDAPGGKITSETDGDLPWVELLPRTKLEAHKRHFFKDPSPVGPVTHVRLSIFPDGGVSRLRLLGRPVD